MRSAYGWWRQAVIALLVAATPPAGDGESFDADAFDVDAFDSDAFSGLV